MTDRRQDIPEGSVVTIDGLEFEVKHNPHFSAFDLFQCEELMLTVNAKILPLIADAVRFP
ncbi:hypothetical protein HW571_02975 [Agrobacterium genomosp. 3]|uniref:hypothetical protein n=1 Tax=Rhizobium/Agrobacterium group TaxID=227290 RepID=UPI000629F2EB|nr:MULTISPECIES: hypothetical protein [Rhizobium/Agrobacterium group]MBP8937835.1 hypothetical protein [Agrobacterium sp.]MCA1864631.1 hypothetical protein [Agrobacterium tomkonis]MCA1875372.1 hypothetical protein [Agrobacterium tumefaciens]KRA63057.1 hypothetical protein ASD85_06285 [Rhizobium sp. Root651]MCA1891288.1 hypothetical protein [Agrobacterium tomkonis]